MDSTCAFELTPEQYYEPIEQGENYEDDCIPQYDRTINYINDFDSRITDRITEDELEYSIIKIQESIKSDRTLKTTYFGNESDLIYSIDNEGWELIIQSIRVADNCIVITRMERANTNSEWINISYSTGLNYKVEDLGREIWYSAKNGEYIRQNIATDKK